jgi:hypothetical protein
MKTSISIFTIPEGDILEGQVLTLKAQLHKLEGGLQSDEQLAQHKFRWSICLNDKEIDADVIHLHPGTAQWTAEKSGEYTIHLAVLPKGGGKEIGHSKLTLRVQAQPLSSPEPVTVRLEPAVSARTDDDVLFQSIRECSESLSFTNYQRFVDRVMCHGTFHRKHQDTVFNKVNQSRATVFPGVDAYQRLKVATEVYLMLSVHVLGDKHVSDKYEQEWGTYTFPDYDPNTYENKHGDTLSRHDLQKEWNKYLKSYDDHPHTILPVDELIRIRLKEPIIPSRNGEVTACTGILEDKLRRPCFFELIWSYWHEESMLVQTMKSIAVRFQNRRVSEHDPLASFDIAPLYPLNNLIWGYVQDEQHRLTVPRRNYEYDHHYGIALDGRAVPALRSADSRSKFLEAFHNLLHRSLLFFKLDDDTTIKADAFPLLTALKEVHLLLRAGQHNAFGDLPSTARQEMLMEQWILARPEMQVFLGGLAMMPYKEAWMDRVDTMKKLKSWTDVSVIYFNDLAKFGEMLLLSIRYNDWSNISDAAFAAHWAREWRQEILQYVHAYRTVTGVDLSPEQTDVRLASDRYLQPSVHLRKRLVAQLRGAAPSSETGSRDRVATTRGALDGRNSSTPIGTASSRRSEMALSEDF